MVVAWRRDFCVALSVSMSHRATCKITLSDGRDARRVSRLPARRKKATRLYNWAKLRV